MKKQGLREPDKPAGKPKNDTPIWKGGTEKGEVEGKHQSLMHESMDLKTLAKQGKLRVYDMNFIRMQKKNARLSFLLPLTSPHFTTLYSPRFFKVQRRKLWLIMESFYEETGFLGLDRYWMPWKPTGMKTQYFGNFFFGF